MIALLPYIAVQKERYSKKGLFMSIYKIDRHTVELTHADRMIFSRQHITKGEIFTYYQKVAPFMLLHVKNRILSLQRFPQGVVHEGFYQKNTPDYFPSFVKRFPLKTQEGELVNYMVCTNQAMLLYLVNQGCITFHRWLSRTDKIERPDQLIFDLDPAKKGSFAQVVWAAQLIKERLKQDKLSSFVMTTGSKGVHVVVALARRYSFEYVRAYARSIANEIVLYDSKNFTLQVSKNKRGNALYIDTLRNAYGQTAVVPFSIRAKSKPSIAMPITWQELKKIPAADHFTLKSKHLFDYIVENPWVKLYTQPALLPRFKQ